MFQESLVQLMEPTYGENQQDSYIDKNFNHSIKLQAIGTANKLITNLFVGFPGSAHDYRVNIFKYLFYLLNLSLNSFCFIVHYTI